jgi:hypothetical protein
MDDGELSQLVIGIDLYSIFRPNLSLLILAAILRADKQQVTLAVQKGYSEECQI